MTLETGARLGAYEILGLIGAGGMGQVYRARDTRLQRTVAIKILPPESRENADRLKRFEQEARAAGALNHPNIPAVHDVGADRGQPFGRSLEKTRTSASTRGAIWPLRSRPSRTLEAAEAERSVRPKPFYASDLLPPREPTSCCSNGAADGKADITHGGGAVMRDLEIHLTHRPGELARVAEALGRYGVNIKSLAALEIDQHAIVRIIPDDIEPARTALEQANVRFSESEVVTVLLENRAGEVAKIANRLAEGKVNLRGLYVTGLVDNLVELAIVADDPKKAKRVLS
jgi:hypothetical protein